VYGNENLDPRYDKNERDVCTRGEGEGEGGIVECDEITQAKENDGEYEFLYVRFDGSS